MTGRLLFVVNNWPFFVSHRLPIAQAAVRAGYDVHLATADKYASDVVRNAGIQWHPFRLSRAGRNVVREMATIWDLAALYRGLRPDIVHHVTSKPVLYGTPIARAVGVRAVVNAISGMGHVWADSSARLTRALVKLGYRAALRHPRMRVVFQNDEHRALFLGEGWIRPEQAVLIPGAGVDVRLFAPTPPPSGEPVVLLASRMLWTKGIGEFVEAARRLRAQGIRARFVLAGATDPENLGAIAESQLKEWNAGGVVEYWGFHEDVRPLLAQAHIACLPSYSEGLPKSLAEAAACGLPIVASDVGGCRAVVEHGVNGLLVPPRSVDALTSALGRLIENPELRARLGHASRERAVRDLAVEGIVAAHLRVYASLLS
jgi:glycosyltransferase involved in cell wall biosynthesis